MIPYSQQQIKGVIFDLDGTLIDSLGTFTEVFNKGTKIYGLEAVTDKIIARFLDEGLRLGQMLLEIFPSVFKEEITRQSCEEEIRKAYLD